ncbi:helix-turn-helix domain-containing protein [Halovivax limisalsi]|uniref:helix-turn-helix domain-containing protein n=1 Tax=Halovivax limisalsi TaxID=1453760 RepID=UPI001FFDD3F1|nr:helix-turn-helix domain-containing protein [Halovivax limisalsi]
MSVTIEFTIPASEFAFADAFETAPDLVLEVDRLASHSREWVMPFVWVSGLESAAVESTLGSDSAVADLDLIDGEEDVSYVAVVWSETVTRFVDAIIDGQGLIQEARAADAIWYFTLKFVERSALADFQTHFEEWGYSYTMRRVTNASVPIDREYGLTTNQRETLLTALELGYFAVPREAQIDDLAGALGVSTNAVSERLRRATAALTTNTIAITTPSDAE